MVLGMFGAVMVVVVSAVATALLRIRLCLAMLCSAVSPASGSGTVECPSSTRITANPRLTAARTVASTQ
jgi:hypothetical protein